MKKILLVAPIGKDNAVNGGYNKVANNLDFVFEKHSHIYNYNYNSINSNDLDSINEIYDIVVFQCHPDMFTKTSKFLTTFYAKKHLFKTCYLYIMWETSPFPSRWCYLDEVFDGFLSASDFCVFEMKKVSKKEVYKFPFFIEDAYVQYNNLKLNINVKKNEEYFTVLFMGQNTKRKGLEDALNSFCIFSQGKKDVRLIMKYHNLSNKEIPVEQLIKSYIDSNSYVNVPEIYTIDFDLEEKKIIQLHKDSSVLLFCSRGEGLGLSLIDSNLIGIPVIYTDWSAMSEYGRICNTINIPVRYSLSPATGMSQYNYEFTSVYAVPSQKDILRALELLYANWKTDKQKYYEISTKGTENFQSTINSDRNVFLEEICK